MNYLLDTHIFIWLIFNPNKITAKQSQVLRNATDNIYVSNVSFLEIALKHPKGKLRLSGFLPEQLPQVATNLNLRIIDIGAQTMASCYRLLSTSNHKDPFDRLLIWFCIQNNYTLISTDKRLGEYKKQGLKWV